MPTGVYDHNNTKTPIYTEERNRKISKAQFGKKQSEETVEKRVSKFRDDAHHFWKGDNAGIKAMHQWIRRKFGKPNYCEHCKRTDKKRYEWANKDHKYSRKLDDYIRLCTKCHHIYDRDNNGYMGRDIILSLKSKKTGNLFR